MSDQIDGAISPTPFSRAEIETQLRNKGMKVLSGEELKKIQKLEQQSALEDTDKAAELGKKIGADIIITGRSISNFSRKLDVAGNTYYFYSTELDARAIKTSTSEVLMAEVFTELPPDTDASALGKRDAAIRSIQQMAKAYSKNIVEQTLKNWTDSTKGSSMTASASQVSSEAHLPVSDVDTLPAVKTNTKKNAYAVVIGIEHYRHGLPSANFASHDAFVVGEYLSKTLGFPEENIIRLINDRALKSDLEKYFDQWLSNVVDSDSRVFIYYSGHGAPNPKNGDAYLVPYDGDPAFIDQTGYSLKRLYASLGNLKSKNIIVILDACFSGSGGKSVIAKGSRALVRVEKAGARNMVVMTASADTQISSTYDEKGHGVFTYYFLKGIKGSLEKDASSGLEFASLFEYIKPEVEKTSRKLYNNEQTPQLNCPGADVCKSGLR